MKLRQSIYITLTPVNGKEREGGYNCICKGTVALVAFNAFPLSSSEVCNAFHKIKSNIESLPFPHVSPSAGVHRRGCVRDGEGRALLLEPCRSRVNMERWFQKHQMPQTQSGGTMHRNSRKKRRVVCPHFLNP